MTMRTVSICLFSFVLLFSFRLYAGPVVYQSGIEQSLLIELYTSEGCSSCPPAERFLNQFKQHPQLWDKYVPVVFHVDYWNDLGWFDRFSKPEYSKRQRDYARIKNQRTVYTPAFIVNGENWRPRLFNRELSIPVKTVGHLTVTLNKPSIHVEYAPLDTDTGTLQLHIAVLGMNIHSNIRAGENSGKQAQHEFVVLSHDYYESNDNEWKLLWPKIDTTETTELSIAVWIDRPGNPAPIQSVGGPLP